MKNAVYIDGKKPQWKGNFHTHTTLSDGKETPDTVVGLYKQAGYDFLVISDHETYFDSDTYDSNDFKLLAGTETAFLPNPDGNWPLGKLQFSLHIHGIYDYSVSFSGDKFQHMQKFSRPIDFGVDSWQKQINHLKAHNLIVFLNHPSWSRIPDAYMLAVQGYLATEVYNFGSEIAETVGLSEHSWDYCLKNGKRVFCIATDDAHRYSGRELQAFGGFTMVSCDSLDKAGLCAAIKNGNMYASSGPSIYDMRVENGYLKIKCSPAQAVRLVGFDRYVPIFRELNGELIESIEWKIDERLKVVRPEIVGPDGKKAWGQAVFLQDLAED